MFAPGALACSVCERRLHGKIFELPDGRRWCASHASDPRCRTCGIPFRATQVGDDEMCTDCARRAVRRSRDVVPVKEELKRHMAQHGIVVTTPTKIQLVERASSMSPDPHVLGMTNWAARGPHGVDGSITIQVLRGLPLEQFRRVIGHEFAHAAMAGSPGMALLGERVTEGFAEALALVHLRHVNEAGLDLLERSMVTNPEPTYGGGLRLVLPAVERHGLPSVLAALKSNRPHTVGLPPA